MTHDLERLIAEMYLQQKQLMSEVIELRSLVSGSPNFAEGWACPADAARALRNEGVKNKKHLQKLRLDGAFSEKKGEIRNVSKGNRPTWEYHIPSCRKALRRYFQNLQAG